MTDTTAPEPAEPVPNQARPAPEPTTGAPRQARKAVIRASGHRPRPTRAGSPPSTTSTWRSARARSTASLGPNGAGKEHDHRHAHHPRVIPTSGTAEVGGVDVIGKPALAKQVIGVVPQTSTPSTAP